MDNDTDCLEDEITLNENNKYKYLRKIISVRQCQFPTTN